ncbi:MAG: CHASE3 domain-containing protein [Sediminibacterium sp.]|nr:CHASE3 domain-containing protein [Sediminibacterium sp.]MDP3128043.1 CHASE3 domain-containing protein [Sediminibacterium sp.]
MGVRKKHITAVAGVFAILVGCLVLTGWFWDIAFLKSMLPGIITMKFNTAVCFLLLGISLLFLQNDKARPLVVICSFAVAMMGLLTLSEYIFGWNLGIDELIWKEGPGTVDTVYPGRMSEPAAFHFLVIGIALLVIPDRKTHLFIYSALVFIFLISVLAFLSYIFGVSRLNSLPSLTKLALHTATTFMVLCMGIYYSDKLSYLQFSFQKKLAAAFILIIFILADMAYVFSKNNDHVISTAQWVDHTNQVLYQSEQVMSALTDVETGVRGYLLTNNEAFLEPFYSGKKGVLLHLKNLKQLTRDNLPQQQRINFAASLVDERLVLCERLVVLRKNKAYTLSQSLGLLIKGKAIMDVLRKKVAVMQNEEKKLLGERKAENEVGIANTGRFIYFFGILIVAILVIMLVIIFTNFNARKKAEQQLRTANKELEAFSYSVSHDLRTPLRGIDGWSLALVEDYGDQLDEKALQYLGRVRSETQRMGELIDDLLKLSRVSRTEIKPAMVDLSEMAQMVSKRLQEAHPGRQFLFTIQPGLVTRGDTKMLEIMLTNLLGNACKFTGRMPVAKIEFGKASIDHKEVYFIKDNGVGFNMANAKNLFGAFQRMHKQSEFPGTGIGLATVQRIVRLHKGTIWAEASENQGATFYFTIPK